MAHIRKGALAALAGTGLLVAGGLAVTGVLTPVAGSGIDDSLFENDEPAGGAPASAYSFARPCGVGIDGSGSLLVAAGNPVLAVPARTGTFHGQRMTGGRVCTVGSGYAGGAPGAVDVQADPAGNLVIGLAGAPASHTNDETYAQVIVKARWTGTFYGRRMVTGKTYVVAGLPRGGTGVSPPFVARVRRASAAAAAAGGGTGTVGGTPALGASLDVTGIAVDQDGNLPADGPAPGAFGASAVWMVAERAGRYYGQAMRAGDVYPVARSLASGGSDGGLFFDGIPATRPG